MKKAIYYRGCRDGLGRAMVPQIHFWDIFMFNDTMVGAYDTFSIDIKYEKATRRLRHNYWKGE